MDLRQQTALQAAVPEQEVAAIVVDVKDKIYYYEKHNNYETNYIYNSPRFAIDGQFSEYV